MARHVYSKRAQHSLDHQMSAWRIYLNIFYLFNRFAGEHISFNHNII